MSSEGWEEQFGAYGAKWEAYAERSNRAGFPVPTSTFEFHETCLAAISSAQRDWDAGLAFSCVGLWTYDKEVEDIKGRSGILAEWTLVLDSITKVVGWRLHTWKLDMGQGHDYTASALFVRPE